MRFHPALSLVRAGAPTLSVPHRGELLKQLLLLLERDLNLVKLPKSTEEMLPLAAGMSRNQNT